MCGRKKKNICIVCHIAYFLQFNWSVFCCCFFTLFSLQTYTTFAWTNPLHPDLWPDIRKMEAEVVRMCCNMFNGGENTCGSVSELTSSDTRYYNINSRKISI